MEPSPAGATVAPSEMPRADLSPATDGNGINSAGATSTARQFPSFIASLHRRGEEKFGDLGVFIVRRPHVVYSVVCVLFLAFAPGLMLVPSMTKVRAEDLWVDQDSKAKKIQNFVEDNFKPYPRVTRVVLTFDPTDPETIDNHFGNVLTVKERGKTCISVFFYLVV